MFAVLDHFTLLYVICHFWTPVCNVLGSWRHHSVCYIPLFTTPLIVTTISVYNELWSTDVVSRSSPLISSLFPVRWSPLVISFQCLYLGVSFVSMFCLSLLFLSLCLISCLSHTVFASGIEDTCSHGCIFRYFGFPTIWLLRRRQIRTRPLSSNVHIWSTAKSVTIYSKLWQLPVMLSFVTPDGRVTAQTWWRKGRKVEWDEGAKRNQTCIHIPKFCHGLIQPSRKCWESTIRYITAALFHTPHKSP
jgi:hypothetical protein